MGLIRRFISVLYPFISLPEREAINKKGAKKYEPKNALIVKKAPEKFDLNNADTSQLKKIYGIGDKLSTAYSKVPGCFRGFCGYGSIKRSLWFGFFGNRQAN